MEMEICKGCRWNKYPECLGTKGIDGVFIRIDNLKSTFNCGQKDYDGVVDFSLKVKSELELKIDDLQEQINLLKISEVKE